MMNKRGSSHADWAISLGIFLLYILSMLMLIQPGVQPFYKEDELLSIVTENYKASTSFVFYKTPLVIDTTGKQFTPGASSFKVTITAAFPFSGLPNYYAVTDANLVPIANFYIPDLWDTLSFNAPILPDVPNAFYIISNRPAVGVQKSYGRGEVTYDPDTQPEITNTAVPTANFTWVLGSTETLQGISADLLVKPVNPEDIDEGGIYCQDTVEEAQDEKYTALKRKWGFPSSKDFMLLYADTASAMYNPEDFNAAPPKTPGNIYPVCRQELPYEQASVVVEEWATRIVDELGNTVPIRMVARVW